MISPPAPEPMHDLWMSFAGCAVLLLAAYCGAIALTARQTRFWTFPNVSIRLALVGSGLAFIASGLAIAKAEILGNHPDQGRAPGILMLLMAIILFLSTAILILIRLNWKEIRIPRIKSIALWRVILLFQACLFIFLPLVPAQITGTTGNSLPHNDPNGTPSTKNSDS